MTKKYLRNNVTTLAKAIKPVEIEFVTQGVYKKADNAYYVTTPEGFLYAGEQMTAGKWNGATIDLVSGAEYDFAGLDFTPINANGITLNGNNATFKNITIKNSTLPYDAIFNIFYGNIYNLKVVDFNADEADNNRAGVIGGYFTEGVIENVDVDGAVIRGFQKVAGLLSYVTCDRGNVTVKNCDVKNVTINAVDDGLYQAGGLVGYLTNARYTVNFEKNTVDALTINNATGWAEGETDADFVQFYSHAFVGSMSQKPTTEADAATSFVIFTDNTIGTVTADPALSVSPRGNEFFGDRRANGFTYQKNTYLGTVIVDGVTLPNRINVVLENLQAAIEAAEDGATVTLAEDLTLGADEAVVIAADQNITLDLTGKNITIEADRTASEPIQNYGTLNIVGGTIVGAESEMSKDIITNNGTMTISGVTISQNYNVGAAIANSGNLTIDGDENEFTTIAATVRNEEGSDAVLTINGGKFVQTGTYAANGTYKYNVDARGGEVIIKGGEFTSNNGVLNVMCEMTIDGGKFYIKVDQAATRHLAYLSTNANLTVNGGEFEGYANPSAGGAFFCLASAAAKLVLNDGYFASYWVGGNANRVVEVYAAGATYEINGGYYSNNLVSGPHYANNTDEATKDKYPYVVKGVVASVDGVEYSELSAALEAAASSSSKTVNVAAGEHEISGDIAEGLTIVGVMDGEDYLTTIQMPDVLNAENVTIKDMKITQPLAGNHDVDKKVSAIRLNGCGTFENCYIEGYNAFYMGYSLYDMTGDVYFKDCVLKATWAYCISTGGTGNVYIEGCDLYGWNSFSKTGKVTIKNSTINSNGTYCKLRFYDAAEVTGSTLADDVSIDFMNYPSTTSVDGKEITFTGNTFNGNLIDAVDTSCFASASPIFTIDGKTYVADGVWKTAEDTFEVFNANGLKYALGEAAKAGAGDTLITIEENLELDMSGIDWTPIKVDGYNGADIVTLNGNGATLKGLNAALFEGGFAGNCGIVIENLTIKDSTMSATNTTGYGAFVCAADSMEKIVLTNCHADNVTITTPENAESRMGVLIGWTAGYSESYPMTVTVEGCSVKNSTINGFGSVGGIIGHAGNNAYTYMTITDCVVDGNTLHSTDDGGWRVGAVVGTANTGTLAISNTTINNNAISQVDKTAPVAPFSEYYGRFVPGTTGVLTIDGTELPVVAEINGVWYKTLQAALSAAQDNDVINLYPGTYNFGGLSIAPATVTIKGTDKAGVVINMNESIYLSGKTVNFENLTYTAPAGLNYTEQAFAFVHHAAGFNFDNCVINRLRLNVASATIQNSTFEVITNSGFDGYGLYYYGNDKSNVKVENCVFNTTGKAICVYSESAKEYNLTVNDTQFYVAEGNTTDKAAVSIHAEYGIYGTLTMNRCEATGFIANNNGLWRELNNNTKVDTKNFTKIIDGVVIEDITGGFGASADGEVVVW